MSSREKDDFWDIEKLIPKKKQTLSTFSTKPKPTLITLSSEEDNKQKAETALTMPQNDGSREVFSYETDSGLVRKVSITKFVDKYDFYGNFRKAALVYYDYKTPKCDFVPFYSYIKTLKIESASYMLEHTDKTVIEIANEHGYDNASKFAAAFRSIKEVSPIEYRTIHSRNKRI